MTSENLKRASEIYNQIEVLTKFLEVRQKKCWNVLSLFATPKQDNTQISCKTYYGLYNEEISASERLSASIAETIKKEIELLQEELDAL